MKKPLLAGLLAFTVVAACTAEVLLATAAVVPL
jgi:hypothetical protein